MNPSAQPAEKASASFAIGAVSKQTGVGIETIRYYERIGLVPAPLRTGSGRRIYDSGYVHRLIFIRHARALGFSTTAIKKMLSLQGLSGSSCREVSLLTIDRLHVVDRQIGHLQALRGLLTNMIGNCNDKDIDTCRILNGLAHPLELPDNA